jgi:hypothetical protein
MHSRDDRGLSSIPPEPGEVFSLWDSTGKASSHPPTCVTEKTTGRVTSPRSCEWSRNCPGSMRTYVSQTRLDCVGRWSRATSHTFFRGDHGISTLRCVTFWDAQGAETILMRLADQRPSRTLQANKPPPAIHLPPLPALTTMRIGLRSGRPSARLNCILSSVRSAPALASITFTSEGGWYGKRFPSSGPWVDIDKWLARMTLQAEVKGSLVVIMVQRPEDWPVWEGSLPEFRKSGGELTIETVVDKD